MFSCVNDKLQNYTKIRKRYCCDWSKHTCIYQQLMAFL